LRPPSSTLFPYTTLFRSCGMGRDHRRLFRAERRAAAAAATAGALSPGGLGRSLRNDRGVARQLLRVVGSAPHRVRPAIAAGAGRTEEHTSELQSRENLVC